MCKSKDQPHKSLVKNTHIKYKTVSHKESGNFTELEKNILILLFKITFKGLANCRSFPGEMAKREADGRKPAKTEVQY